MTDVESLKVSGVVPSSPNRIYATWLDERKHTAFTGSRSTLEPRVGGRHTTKDGSVEGMLVGLDTGSAIRMTWRTADFPSDAYDSLVEVTFVAVAGGTEVTVTHSGIPKSLVSVCKAHWKTHYLDALQRFFESPEAMREAIRAAARSGRLPIPGFTHGGFHDIHRRRPFLPPTATGTGEVDPNKVAPEPAPKSKPTTKKSANASPRTPKKVKKSGTAAVGDRAKAKGNNKSASKKATKKTASKAPTKKIAAKKTAPKKAAAKKSSKAAKKKVTKKKVVKKTTPKRTAKKTKSPATKRVTKKKVVKKAAKKAAAKKRTAKTRATAKKVTKKRVVKKTAKKAGAKKRKRK